MISVDVVVVGGGPAGAACASQLKRNGFNAVILDRETFPRPKLCAGWITPRVWRKLGVSPTDYPHDLLELDRLFFHICGGQILIPTCQYSIRRMSFDQWLVQQSGVPVYQCDVNRIDRQGDDYVINETWQCHWLVGAGGAGCPVYRRLFREIRPRDYDQQIVSLESELAGGGRVADCHLWFFVEGLPGYGWYVPKADGGVAIGLGARSAALRRKRMDIREKWQRFVKMLVSQSYIKSAPSPPSATCYFLRHKGTARVDNAFVIGDAAGLATRDMGEGIGPAIESGLLAADAIAKGGRLSFRSIPRFSLRSVLSIGRA